MHRALLWLIPIFVACGSPRTPAPTAPVNNAPLADPPPPPPSAIPTQPNLASQEVDPPPAPEVSDSEYAEHEEHELLDLAELPPPPATPPAIPTAPEARQPFHAPLPPKETPTSAPAAHYATLSAGACRAELSKRKLGAARVGGNVRGVATPVRLPKELNGVRMIVPPTSTPWGLLDCRLALTLDDLAKLLAKHEVTAMSVGNFYRPWSKLRKNVKSQHHYGLAADIVGFTLKDGRRLSVERDFQATIGEAVCGPDAVMHTVTDEAVRLRNLVCAVAAAKLFHHMLSPSFNAAHRDHFHWDIKRKGYATIVR